MRALAAAATVVTATLLGACIGPSRPGAPGQIWVERERGVIYYKTERGKTADLERAVARDPEALEHARTWKRRTFVGTVLWVAGGACAAFGGVALAVRHAGDEHADEAWYEPTWLGATTLGCLAVGVAGVVLVGVTERHRSAAIEVFNDHVVQPAAGAAGSPAAGDDLARTPDPVPRRAAWGTSATTR